MIQVIDNYDSFTYNLVQLIAGLGRRVEVLRNDALPCDGVLDRRPAGVVLSPGPGRPEESGVCMELLAARPRLPILGVCLGHQAMGVSFGAVVGRATRLVHGKTSRVRHDGQGLFSGMSQPFIATRYHSLEVEEATLPPDLEATAWAEDGTLMAMRHRELPYFGVQFHPESILTVEGAVLMRNFLDRCTPNPRAKEAR